MSQPEHYELERLLTKYGEQRRAEAGEALELHKSARERLHAEVEDHYGRGNVSAQESAEKFASTLAWQQNLGRWWHALVPKIGFAGACFAAVMVVFTIAHREAQQQGAAPPVADFLEMAPLADQELPAIVPDAPLPLEDTREAEEPPIPVTAGSATLPRARPAPTETKPRAIKSRAQPVREPQPEPAAMVVSEIAIAPGLDGVLSDSDAGSARSPKSARVVAPKVSIAPPVWKGKRAAKVRVNLPETLVAPATVVSEPVMPSPAAPAFPKMTATTKDNVATSSSVPVSSGAGGFSAEARSRRQSSGPGPSPTSSFSFPTLRVGLAATHSRPVLRRFDVVLEGATIAIRDQDGSIYQGPAGPSASDAAEFTARGRSRSLRQTVTLKGRLMRSGTPAMDADVLLGDGTRFKLDAAAR